MDRLGRVLMKDGLVLSDRIFEVRLALSLRNEVGLACFDPGLIGSVIRFHGGDDACDWCCLGFPWLVRILPGGGQAVNP